MKALLELESAKKGTYKLILTAETAADSILLDFLLPAANEALFALLDSGISNPTEWVSLSGFREGANDRWLKRHNYI